MPKTVLPSKFQEWKGVDRIQTVVHDMKCIFREISKDDYGLDGEIEIVVPKPDGTGYETTGGIIKVQAKSGVKYVVRDSLDSFSTPVERADLEGWHRSAFPVLLIVYHPKDDKLYWKEIRNYVTNTAGVFTPPFHVVFDKTADEFNDGIRNQLSRVAEVSPPRITTEQQERLFSNLLRIKKLPTLLTYAPTDYKDVQDVKSHADRALPPFVVASGKLYTLDDLRDPACRLRGVCDTSDINDEVATKWANDGERRKDFVYLLRRLLAGHLRRCGLKYNKQFKRDFFPRENDEDLEFKRDWHSVRTGRNAPPRTTAKFYRYGRDEFWRHLAARLSFKQIGPAWFLQVTPQYFFTTDGETPWESERVGPYTTKKKARERNNAVLNHVLFWSDVLSLRKPAIEVNLYSRTLLVIEKLPAAGVAGFAIPDDPAVYEEEDEGQLGFFDLLAEGPDEDDAYEF